MPLLEAQYINHKGQKIAFGDNEGLFLNEHDLFNFNWDVQTRGNRIVGVSRKGVKEHPLPIVIVASTRDRACKFANDLFAICESDLQANQKGRLVVNGYNLKCFVRGQDYSDWSDPSKCIKISAKVIRDSVWYKTLDPITFGGESAPQIGTIEQVDINSASLSGEDAEDPWTGGEKGYYHGYPYDYPSIREEYHFINNEGAALSWQAIIYGPASNISFSIGSNTYSVPGLQIGTNERLEITAKEAPDEKTIYKILSDETRVNCFSYRSQGIFTPIPTGDSLIAYESGLTWKLIPIVERSSPKWL